MTWMQIKYYIKYNFTIKFCHKIHNEYNILLSFKWVDPRKVIRFISIKYSTSKFIDHRNVFVKKQKYRLR